MITEQDGDTAAVHDCRVINISAQETGNENIAIGSRTCLNAFRFSGVLRHTV
jgi:hypothetical protein